MKRPIRVFQVATGNVGTEMIGRIVGHSDLELVGLHCYTPEKVGRDAGEIVGLPAVGVTATGTVDEIIAAAPESSPSTGYSPTSNCMNAS
jgi:4-hydroxy-tetrahydrodipicolinate reductase